MINRLHRRLVDTRLFRFPQILNIKNIRRRMPIRRCTRFIHLIELVVEEEVVHFDGVGEPTLVGVCGAWVGGFGDDFGGAAVGDVHDGEGVFVVVEADFAAPEGDVGASVDDALCWILSVVGS